jgi:NADH-ubiquinone oxidoreductase chain 6
VTNKLPINLYFLYETITNNYSLEFLNILSLFTIICGVYVIISKNPIISILFLIGLFAGISVYLILIGLNFIGLSYLIIYIGAVSILFLFILMLIDIRISEFQNNNNNSLLLAIIITIIFSYSIFQVLPYNIAVLNNYFININHIIYNLSFNNIQFFSVNNYKNNEIFFTNSND